MASGSDTFDYRRDPCGFIDRFLPRNEKGQPWALSAYQRRVIGLAIRFDATGRLLLRVLLWSEPKKSGKTLLAAALAWWWCATHGSTEVLIVANDLEQSTSRVFATMVALAKHNGFEQAKLCKILSAEIRVSTGTTVKAIASEYRGAAGSRHSLVVFDELWGFDSERLQRLFEELTPPPTEPNAWLLIVTYAGFTGESALLEGLYRRGLGGERLDDDLEVTAAHDLVMFWSHVARQPWLTAAYYEEQRRLLRPSTYLRLHENRWVTGTEAFITGELYDACVDRSYRPPLRPIGPVCVGVDAALKHDTAAVVAVEVTRDGLALVAHRIWKPTSGETLDLEATVEAFVRELHARMRVVEVLCDPWQMARSIATLKATGIPIREYPQSSGNLTAMGSALFDAIKARQLRLYADDDLRAQALNAVAVDSGRGWRIAKEKASRKIDAVVALAMACVAAVAVSPGCPHCDDEDCTWPDPPFGLAGSPYVAEWHERHPVTSDCLEPAAGDAVTRESILDRADQWIALSDERDIDGAATLLAAIARDVVVLEEQDPQAADGLLDLIEMMWEESIDA